MATAPQAAMEMPQEGANPFADPNTMAVYEQMRQTVSPKEFGDQMLAGAEQTAPEEVAAFRSALEQIQMPPEALELLNNMVDEILANPEQYAEIRAKYKEMGAPDEILPEQFDPQFFAALNMAVDQMIGEPAGEQAFAKGGIAELKPVSKAIASYGRNGDTMLAHITPAEARMLRRKGGSGTINPKTGLPEFFNLFKEIGNAFKAVGKAVKSFASSTVGRIVTTVALGFFLGPAAASFMGATSTAAVAAVSGFVGSAGSTLLAGGNLSQALKAGAMGGLTAGAVSGVTGGFSTDYAGPTTVGGQFDRFTNAITPSAATPSGIQAPSLTPSGQATGMAPIPEQTINPLEKQFATPAEIARVENINPAYASDATLAKQQLWNNTAQAPANFVETPVGAAEQVFKAPGAMPAAQASVAPPVDASAATAVSGNTIAPPIGANPMDATQFEGSLTKLAPGSEPSFFDNAKDFYNKNISPSGIQQQGLPAAQEAGAKAVTDLVARMPDATPAMKEAAYQKALNAASPGILSTYGPATALGIGAIGAFGGFSPSKVPESSMRKTLMGGPGSAQDLLKNDPSRFYIQGLPGVQYYSGSVMKPPGMATGGEVQHFADGGVSDQVVADWWAENSGKGYSDAYIADLMDEFSVTPEQFARSIGANEATAADIASRYTAVPENITFQDADGYNSIDAIRQADGTYIGNNGQVYDNRGTPITGGTGGGGTTVVTDGGGGTTTVTDGGGGTTRSAADQAIWNYFANNTSLTDEQIVGAIKSNNWTLEDIARVTGTPDRLYEYYQRFGRVGSTTSTSTSTSTNTSIIRTTNTSTSTSTSTSTGVKTGTSTGTGTLTSISAPWFINPQTFAQGTAGVTVPSSTLRPAGLPTDATSRAIQGDLLAAGPTASDTRMQQFMDTQGYDPRQVAYAINAGVPEIQNRYYAAKNAGILGAAAPATTTLNQPYNTTAGITQLLSPTGPLGEFSTRTATPVTPVLPVTPTATALPNVSFNRTDIQQRMPNLQMGNAGTPLSVLAGQPTTYGVTGYTDAYSPFATPAPGAKLMNMGGIAGLAQGGYPRRTGQIDGPGTATSDSIPAMLSDGEFVMTAKAVRGAGKGDRRAGAKRMYALMHQLEKNAARG